MALNLLIGGGLALGSALLGNKSRKAQNRARAAQLQANRVRNFQAQRQFMRNFRVAQAEALARGIAGGADPSSSFAQATASSQGAQVKTAQRDFAELTRLGESASANLNRAANASFGSGLLSTLSSFAMSDAGGDLLNQIGKPE
jgi:Tfp pilus assembly protein PilV